MACELIALSDVEPNPGFRCLTDMKKSRGLKIAHLNKINSLSLEIQDKAIDVLTLLETYISAS